MEVQYLDPAVATMTTDALQTYLEAHSDKMSKQTFAHFYTPEEIANMRADLPDKLDEFDDEEEQMKSEIKAMKNRLTAIQKESKAIRRNLRLGFEELTQQVYEMIDWKAGWITYVDDRGIIVKKRPMEANERQMELGQETDTPVVKIAGRK